MHSLTISLSLCFTPAFKALEGEHDENISIARMKELVGESLTEYLQKTSISIYNKARKIAESKGIILADTKFEFGKHNDDILIIDELLTPDSSRYWPVEGYKPGESPPSYDKQIVRDYLEKSGWDKHPPIPSLPEEIIQKASEKYGEIKDILTN